MTLKQKVHFIGILGSGMSSLAGLAEKLGYEVQGSDSGNIGNSSYLNEINIKTSQKEDGWRPAKIVVYSSAISENNPELISARKATSEGVQVLHRSEFLQTLMTEYRSILVSGTHGKSTTSALLTHIFDDLDQDPLSVIGAQMMRYNAPFRFGTGKYFIAEADESDGSFLNYKPFASIITNIDIDHLDYYKSLDNIVSAFDTFINNTSPDGFVALFWDNENCRNLFHKRPGNFITYGLTLGSEIRAIHIKSHGMITEFVAIVERDQYLVKIPLAGKHNILNTLAAIAVAHKLKLPLDKVVKSLASFKGVRRRLNLVFENNLVRIYDDYAHNPGKIEACIRSLKEAFPGRPLVTVFQAHRFSRLATMYRPMLEALKESDHIIVVPVYSAGEPDNPSFNPEQIALDLRKFFHAHAIAVKDMELAPSVIKSLKLSFPTVLTCGAGNIDTIGQKIAREFV